MFAFLRVAYTKHPLKSFHSLQLKCSYRSATASCCSMFSTLHWRNFNFLVPREAGSFAAFYMAVGETTCPSVDCTPFFFCLVLYLDEQPNVNLPFGAGGCFGEADIQAQFQTRFPLRLYGEKVWGLVYACIWALLSEEEFICINLKWPHCFCRNLKKLSICELAE